MNNSRLRIAHVLTSLCVGGGERVALLLAAQQTREGHRVRVVSLEAQPAGPLGAEFEAAGVVVERVAKRPRGFDPSLYPRLLSAFVRARVDVVHTHNQLPLMYAALCGRLAGARVVHTEHGRHPGSPRQLWLRRMGARASQTFVAVSRATADYARETELTQEAKLRVILNGTDVGRFERSDGRRRASRDAWGVSDGTVVIGTVGRMAPVKNHALLLRAAAPLLKRGAFMVIAGDGPERAATQSLAEELGVDGRVRLLGEIDNVAEILSGFDIFALSSDSEGLPMAVAEAMSASLPAVATAVGGVPKVVVDGETGLLSPPGDEEAYRAALEKLASDGALRREMGARGCARAAREYSLTRMAEEYMAAYQGR